MSSLISNLNPVLQAILTFGVLLGGAGYAYEKFTGGRTKKASEQTVANTDLIKGLQTQLDAIDTLMKRQQGEHKQEMDAMRSENTRLTGEVGELRGQLKEKEHKLSEYKEIFQGRNPQIEDTLKMIAEFMGSLGPVMQKISNHFVEEHQIPS